jgi:hypothetical protein
MCQAGVGFWGIENRWKGNMVRNLVFHPMDHQQNKELRNGMWKEIFFPCIPLSISLIWRERLNIKHAYILSLH